MHEQKPCLCGETGLQKAHAALQVHMLQLRTETRKASRQASNRRMPCCMGMSLQLCDAHGKPASASRCPYASYTDV